MPLLMNPTLNRRRGLIQPTYENYGTEAENYGQGDPSASMPAAAPQGDDGLPYAAMLANTQGAEEGIPLWLRDQLSYKKAQASSDDYLNALRDVEQSKLTPEQLQAQRPPVVLGQGSVLAQQNGKMLLNNPAPIAPRAPVVAPRGARVFDPDSGNLIGEGQPFEETPIKPVPVQTVDAQGNPITRFVDPQAGQEFQSQPPASTQSRNEAKKTVANSISQMEELSKKVITEKQAIAQKAKAAGRSVDAFLANDPEYLAYQAGRMSLAGNLAVAQQGARPSDTDIQRVWLPLVPDMYVDPIDSAKLKWKMIRTNIGIDKGGTQSGPAVGTVSKGYRFAGGNPADPSSWEKVQ